MKTDNTRLSELLALQLQVSEVEGFSTFPVLRNVDTQGQITPQYEGEYLQWTVWFQDIARDHSNRNARAGAPQNQITFEMLTATGQFEAIEAQLRCPPLLPDQLKTVVLEVWDQIPPQGEPTARLETAISHTVIGEKAKRQLEKLLAYENANQEYQRAIAPIHEIGTIFHYLKACYFLEGFYLWDLLPARIIFYYKSNDKKKCNAHIDNIYLESAELKNTFAHYIIDALKWSVPKHRKPQMEWTMRKEAVNSKAPFTGIVTRWPHSTLASPQISSALHYTDKLLEKYSDCFVTVTCSQMNNLTLSGSSPSKIEVPGSGTSVTLHRTGPGPKQLSDQSLIMELKSHKLKLQPRFALKANLNH
ncbi:hypothetical protein Celaphus_00018002 [Cervus elaphus hippelaphus]|uniref:Retroviral nucleocapsid Gag protein p24 C-terminal domain-containing protein n=1 Tax=Cervus elaphus hippelaphus TaxID=46360 RepID=A0A212C8C4_CEREH|nr:hypothetical protein Celaphus_00018002 [Cervus elaphus hippelaphus]